MAGIWNTRAARVGSRVYTQAVNSLRRRPLATTSDAPTITYSASLTPAGRRFLPWKENATPLGCALNFNSATPSLDLALASGMQGAELVLDGDNLIFGWKCQVSNSERFMYWIDGAPVSLTPASTGISTSTGTWYWATLSFASAARRRIEILMTGAAAFVSCFVPTTQAVQAAPPKRKVMIVGDSFLGGSAAISNGSLLPASWLARTYDLSVFNNALGGTGYTADGSFTRFGSTTRVGYAAAFQPDDIIIMGSVNDDGRTGIQDAAYAAITAYQAAAPNARVRVLGPQPGSATDTLSANRKANCLAVRAAATAAGVPYTEMVGYVDDSALSAWTNSLVMTPGQLVTYLGSIWRYEGTTTQSLPSQSAPGASNFPGWSLVTAHLYGTGSTSSIQNNGTRDVLLHSDGVHPTERQCQNLAEYIAQALGST